MIFTKPGTSKRVEVTNPATIKTLEAAGWTAEQAESEQPKRRPGRPKKSDSDE